MINRCGRTFDGTVEAAASCFNVELDDETAFSSLTMATLAWRQRSRAAGVMTAERNIRSVWMPESLPSNVEALTTWSATASSLLTTTELGCCVDPAKSPASNVLSTLRTMDSISTGFTFMVPTMFWLETQAISRPKDLTRPSGWDCCLLQTFL